MTYIDKELELIIQTLQSELLSLVNVFPFFESIQPNINFLTSGQTLVLMRELLHALINIMENNKKPNATVVKLEHDYLTLLYRAYEACLKNWYEDEHNPDLEKRFRSQLMQELLTANKWTFNHVTNNLRSRWVDIGRDNQGWMQPARALTDVNSQQSTFFKSITGVEINHETGQIDFKYVPWKQGDSAYSRLISLFDIHELLDLNIGAAVFSLDLPSDDKTYRDMRFHPFNKMRLMPARLYGSQLAYWMLMADYLLKFLTTGHEVQAAEPFDIKPIDTIIQKLPAHLKKIINDIRQSKAIRGDNIVHRFWIEAEPITYAESSENEVESTHIKKIAFDEMKMVIKKHQMRFINGELKDVEENNEGWSMYINSSPHLNIARFKIQDRAMIWQQHTSNVYLYDNGMLKGPFTIKNYAHHINKLFRFKHDGDDKILTNDSQVLETLYRVTREVSKQTNEQHHFSAEYIFAREFTTYYNEFATHFVELGRIRELSKAVAVSSLLKQIHHNHSANITALTNRINDVDVNYWAEFSRETKPEIKTSVAEAFSNWRANGSFALIRTRRREQLADIQRQIGGWDITKRRSEIRERFDNNIRQQGGNPYQYESEWQSEWGKLLAHNEQQFRQLLNNLQDAFWDHLPSHLSNKTQLLSDFLHGNSERLYDALVSKDIDSINDAMTRSFPNCNLTKLQAALNESSNHHLDVIVNTEFERYREKLKVQIRDKLAKLTKLANTLSQLGLKENENEMSLEGMCLWVPASVYHSVDQKHSYTVYGGVQIAPQLNQANSQIAGALSNQAANNASISSQSQVQINRQNGNAFRDQVAQQFRDAGYQVQTEIYKRTDLGGRYIDVQVQKDGVTRGFETKTGNSPYTAAQRAKDSWLLANEGYRVYEVRKG